MEKTGQEYNKVNRNFKKKDRKESNFRLNLCNFLLNIVKWKLGVTFSSRPLNNSMVLTAHEYEQYRGPNQAPA